jgi:hypothetical protein
MANAQFCESSSTSMYREFIKRKFPHNESLGLYVAPQLPGSKLGRILMKETRVKQPGDVVAMYLDSGLFSSSHLLLTDTKCFFEGGSFDLETLRSAKAEGKRIEFLISTPGSTQAVWFKSGSEEAATIIARLMDDLAYWDKESETETESSPGKYAAFEGSAVDWLLLRDEVMRSIDMLYERFQDGKLSLLEYEEKKTDLLGRL